MSRLKNQEAREALKGSMDTNQGVQLPFVAPMMWWKNGEVALKPTYEVKDARRFGGWGISEEEVVNASLELPASFHKFEMSGTNGSYNAYLARWVYAAPICRRFVWFQKTDSAWTSKLNILVYMAGMDADKNTVPFGPVVITSKGFSGKYIDEAFKKFSMQSAALRDGDPINYFYHPIGTFEAEPVFEKITGKGGSSSSITPCQLFVRDGGYSDEDMDNYFVGDEIVGEMVDLYKQAEEWMHDWDKKDNKQNGNYVDDPSAATMQAENDENEFPF